MAAALAKLEVEGEKGVSREECLGIRGICSPDMLEHASCHVVISNTGQLRQCLFRCAFEGRRHATVSELLASSFAETDASDDAAEASRPSSLRPASHSSAFCHHGRHKAGRTPRGEEVIPRPP